MLNIQTLAFIYAGCCFLKSKEMTSIQKVNKICKSVLALSEEDLLAVEKMAIEQQKYIHPLKYATAAKINKKGVHNENVLTALIHLRTTIKNGEEICKK